MPKSTRLSTVSVLIASLLAFIACQDTAQYTGPLSLDGESEFVPVTLSPSAFHLEEGGSIPLEVKTTTDLAVSASRIRWSVEPSAAAEILDGRTLVARSQSGVVRVTATVGRATATTTGSISAVPARIEQASARFATGVVASPLSDSLAVLVLSASGMRVEGTRVTFELVSGDGSLSDTERVTGPDGLARTAWTLGPKPGTQVVRASAGATSVDLPVDAWPDYATARARVISGVGQDAVAGELLPEPLTVSVTDSLGNPLPGMSVTWTFSSGNGFEAGSSASEAASPLTVVTDDRGLASVRWSVGTTAGLEKALATVAIRTQVEGQSDRSGSQWQAAASAVSVDTNVRAGPAHAIEISPNSADVEVGGEVAFSATARDTYQNPIEGPSVVWRSSNPAVATIDENGVLTGHSEGTVTVTATLGQFTERATVDVSGGYAEPLRMVVAFGQNQQGTSGASLRRPLRVRVVDARLRPVRGMRIRWSLEGDDGSLSATTTSTDPNGYSSTSLTLGARSGLYVVHASASELGTVDFRSTAGSGAPVAITVQPGATSVAVGETAQLSAAVLDQLGNGVDGVPVTWSSSATRIASVDPRGRATGVRAGTAYITARSGELADSVAITVTDADSPSKKGDPEAVATLRLESVTSTTATVRWTQVDDGTGKPAKYALRYATPKIDWSTAHATEISIGGTSVGAKREFTIKGLEPNTAYEFKMVSYRGTLNKNPIFGKPSNTASGVTESEVEAAGDKAAVMVTPSSVSLEATGKSMQLFAVATNKSGQTMKNASFTWRSLRSSVATVTAAGLVRARAAGTALIVVSAACCGADTTMVTVEGSGAGGGSAIGSVAVSPSSVNGMTPGDERQFIATVKDVSGKKMNAATVAWSSSDATVATVDESGLVTAVGEGSATILAAAGSKVGSGKVSVTGSTPPSTAKGLLFSDGFESGDLGRTENGFRWREGGAHVFAGHARTGEYALRFRYGPDKLGDDSSRQHNFVLAPTAKSAPREVWIEYWIRVPDNYRHRDNTRSDNNKFFAIWSENYGDWDGEVHAVVEYDRSSDAVSHARLASATAEPCESRKPFRSQTASGDVFSASMAGTWQRFRIHIKSQYRASAVAVWRGNARIVGLPSDYSITCPGWAGKSDYLRKGFILGWANSGFAEETDFWLDDFKIYTADPGW
jgi:uncharacterized protein YjdB